MEYNIFVNVLTSLQRLFVGYIAAAVLGIFFGLIIGINPLAYQILKRLLQIAHSILPIALLPIALIAFQQIEPAAFIVVFFSAFWSIILDTARGMRQFRQKGNSYRTVLYHIFNALRSAIWIAWFTVIATEMLIGKQGLGFVLWSAYNSRNINSIILAIFYTSIISFLLDQLLDIIGYFLSQIVLDGKPKDEGASK
ncbi:MAG: nitrate transporter [Scytonema sp. PMC 1069.18]|nr:nitrate transporter [Scytonema sp. PMC 1069.18]MEC4881400.1 nitrate transporter [Scytonema sp. PMC 1070.18]